MNLMCFHEVRTRTAYVKMFYGACAINVLGVFHFYCAFKKHFSNVLYTIFTGSSMEHMEPKAKLNHFLSDSSFFVIPDIIIFDYDNNSSAVVGKMPI